MKILVVSLLRMGDIFQQVPLLKELRKQHPHADIHLLINKQFSGVVPLLKELVHSFHFFDRESIQKGMGEASYNILWPYMKVSQLIENLRVERFDLIYNFTHTKLSAHLVGLLGVPVKGISASAGKFHGLDNRWIKYFNDHFPKIKGPSFIMSRR